MDMGSMVVGLVIGAALGASAAAAVWLGGRGRAVQPVGSGERVEARLEVQSAELRRLADATRAGDGMQGALTAQVAAARAAVGELAVHEHDRRTREAETLQVVRRLSTVLAGGSSKGRAGENVLREQLAALPPGMLVTDLRVNGKVVEYALELPDGRRLPVDSKWSADLELERLAAATEDGEREAAARAVEKIVTLRAREVAAYLDPALTAPVAVAAIPDAAYEVLRRAHFDAYAKGVVIVSYSTALPILLFLHSIVSRYGSTGDLQACLGEFAGVLDQVEVVLENKFARASTMLANGNDELRSHVGKARGSLARARGTAAPLAGDGVEPEAFSGLGRAGTSDLGLRAVE